MDYSFDYDAVVRDLEKQDPKEVACIMGSFVPYRQALELQHTLRSLRIADRIPDTIWILEHPKVITLGIRKDLVVLLSDEQTLSQEGIEVVNIGRGGGATAHNPGQLIIYPIVKLSSRNLRVVTFVHFLEEVCIQLLAEYGVVAHRRTRYPGVWVKEKKIASLGVELARGVTMHGIACNIVNDLSIFTHIVPCGIDGVEMTSLEKETGMSVDMGLIKERAAQLCKEFFLEHPVKRSEVYGKQ